jgi:hypothetical protein
LRSSSATVLVTLALAGSAGTASTPKLPALPTTWPHALQLGVADDPGGAAALRKAAPFGFRYQYLAGGVNTGQGWATWNPKDHFQDNREQWLLGPGSRAHLRAYAAAGFAGFLFGRGADGATCACDAAKDGRTNPAPINGNTRSSLSADDDGGYFKAQARAYYRSGAITLPR